jgi:phosphoglycolate phosphatase
LIVASAHEFSRVLFDLDGTLTDPSEGITLCMRHALKELGIVSPELTELARFIGPPLRTVFVDVGVPAADVPRAVELFRERFGSIGLYENQVYEGVPEMLHQLSSAGLDLRIATSKPTEFAVRILDHFALSQFFSDIVGATLDGSRDSKADVIAHAIRDTGPAATVMIGDRMHDLQGATAHGIPAIGVTWGFGSYDELAAEAPIYIAASVPELAAAILSPGCTHRKA